MTVQILPPPQMSKKTKKSRVVELILVCAFIIIGLPLLLTPFLPKTSVKKQISVNTTPVIHLPITDVWGTQNNLPTRFTYSFVGHNKGNIWWYIDDIWKLKCYGSLEEAKKFREALDKIPNLQKIAFENKFQINNKLIYELRKYGGDMKVDLYSGINGSNPMLCISILNNWQYSILTLNEAQIERLRELLNDLPDEYQKWEENEKKQNLLK